MFTIRPEQSARLRQEAIARGLVETFAGSKQQLRVDRRTGEVLATDPRGHTTRFGFDERGFVGNVTSPLGRVWKIENDSEGKPLAMSNPASLQLRFSYDEQQRPRSVFRDQKELARFSYEPAGSLTEVRHVDGTFTRIQWRDPRRPSVITNRLGEADQYEYDAHGSLIAVTDANHHRTLFRYDERGSVAGVSYADGSSESYLRGPNGELSGIELEGRVVVRIAGSTVRYADGGNVACLHDDEGRVVEARSAGFTCRYKYDAEGRVIEEDQNGEKIGYTYDDSGTLTAMKWPSGEQASFSWDADLRLECVNDWNGGSHRFRYAGGDRAITLRAPNSVSTTTTYSENALPLNFVGTGARSEKPLFDFRCEYDDEDRLRVFRDAGSRSREYDYDAEGRLLAVRCSDPDLDERFCYDKAGNRTRVTGAEATFNALNQLTTQGTRRCRYDARGNMVENAGTAVWRYTWNDRNQMVRADGPNGRSVSFDYDAFGRRILKRSGAVETRFIWAGEHLVREIRMENGRRRVQDYLYVPGTFTPLATRIDGEVYCCHTDHLGRVRRLTDGVGNTVWSSDFRAFGEGTSQSVRIPFSLRLPGQYFDEETGLHYNRFRYYSPILGRYLSRDPLSYLSGLNFYTYANNDPVNRADPTGLWTWAGVAKVAAVGIVSVAVGAAVVALAPVALPLAIVAAGAIAGAVGGALNTMLDGNFCWKCIGQAALKGAAVGIMAALPFVFLPAAAGVAAFAGTGAVSGGLGYAAEVAAGYPNSHWNTGEFAAAVGLGAVTAGAGRYLASRLSAGAPTSSSPELDAMYAKAPAAKQEIDDLAEEIAREHGGRVARAEIKSPARALQKITEDYAGDASRLKDLARNTIVVQSGKEGDVLQSLKKTYPEIGPRQVKITNAETDPLGYSDMKVSIPAKAGIPAEIQINSPEMIYAKENAADARRILGDKTYELLASRPDLPPGGRGHLLYDEWRNLPLHSPRAQEIERESRAYYDAFRR